MKKIGIIGGLSWESTIEYYRIINAEINNLLGDLHSAKLIIESYDFDEIAKLWQSEKYDEVSAILLNTAQNLINAGAEVIIIASNAVHKLAEKLQSKISVPIFHIADATGKEITKNRFKKVLLLGTKSVMQEDFYKMKLTAGYGLNVVTPELNEQEIIQNIIFNELCKGICSEKSKNTILEIISKNKQQGTEAVILGCTELPNLINEAPIPLLNTLLIHSKGVVQYSLTDA